MVGQSISQSRSQLVEHVVGQVVGHAVGRPVGRHMTSYIPERILYIIYLFPGDVKKNGIYLCKILLR